MNRVAIALALLTVSACGEGRPAAVEVGAPAPPYEAKSLDGATVSLARLRGRPVLLNVWATWCGPCREEIPYLSRLHTEHHAKGLEIVGVSIDARGEEDQIATFARDIGLNYSIWLDPTHRVTATFMAYGVPASYLLDGKGVVRWKHVGVLRPTNGVFSAALEEVLKDRATP